MQRYFLTAAALAATLIFPARSVAQTLDPADYVYPVLHVAGYYSANFGEMRSDHFHSGIDIKTDGVEGKPLVAVADGYVSRIGVTPGGYGRALYLTLDNGVTAVYGHISRFRNDLEEYVLAERCRQRKNAVQLYPAAGRFRVRQGDVIAFSGNSGSSFGPHLHFELRDTPTQRTLNVVKQGVIRPKDTIPPLFVRIHYIEVDTLDGIPVPAAPQSYDAVKTDSATYRLAQREPVDVGRNGYFVVEATDRRNDVQNTFGIYRMSLEADSAKRFEYRMDGFTFDLSRYCNTASYYPIQITSRNEVIRLALPEGGSGCFCPTARDRGSLRLAPGDRKRLRIEAEDDCGNRSRLEFTVCGRLETFRALRDSTFTALHRDKAHTLRLDRELTARIPAGALYESCYCRPERRPATHDNDSTIQVLSPAYRIFDATTPLHKPITVSIRAYVPPLLQPHVTLATRNLRGRTVYVGGSYADGSVTARTRTTGDLFIVADTTAPTVTPLFKPEGDLSKSGALRFRIGDNFSGIASCTVYIDDRWTPCDRYPVQGILKVPFTDAPSGDLHRIRLEIGDNCSNIREWTGNFRR